MPHPLPVEHAYYVFDSTRTELYRAALTEVVADGCAVLDLGCGVGVLGLLCVEAGAGSVTAIDRGAVVEVAGEALRRALCPDAVTALRAESREFAPDRRFDVVVCDHVGHFGFDYGIVALLGDACERFLAPGGRIVPRALDLYVAPVMSDTMRARVDCWTAPGVPPALHEVRRLAVNRKYAVDLEPGNVLAEPAVLGSIDLSAPNPDFFSWTCEMVVARAGRLDGLGGWFGCDLTANVRMTNSPVAPGRIRRSQVFLPVEVPIDVRPGDRISAEVVARPEDHLIAWTLRHQPSGRRFRHSSWDGMIFTAGDLGRADRRHMPRPTARARARNLVLGYCDGTRSGDEIASAVAAVHPELFPTRAALERFVAEVLGQDTE